MSDHARIDERSLALHRKTLWQPREAMPSSRRSIGTQLKLVGPVIIEASER